MTITKAKWRRNLITFLCVVLIFTTFLPISAFAYLQNASASVLFAWNKYITNSNPRITVYGRNPSTDAADNRTIISMNGLNGHYLYVGGWRPVFFSFGGLGFLLGVVFVFALRDGRDRRDGQEVREAVYSL